MCSINSEYHCTWLRMTKTRVSMYSVGIAINQSTYECIAILVFVCTLSVYSQDTHTYIIVGVVFCMSNAKL